jgi:hypothetical protein
LPAERHVGQNHAPPGLSGPGLFVWLAISPYDKVRWNRAKVWIVLAIIVWYGATDEWLQGKVGRQVEFMDFIWDLGAHCWDWRYYRP